MTEAYLKLLEIFDNEDIYVKHDASMFVITIDTKKEYIRLADINDFITTFVSNKNNKDGK